MIAQHYSLNTNEYLLSVSNKETKIRNGRKSLMAASYLKKPVKMVIAVSTSKKTPGNFVLVKPPLG